MADQIQIPLPKPPAQPGLPATGGGAKCQFARSKLAQFTSSLKESTFAEKAGTLVKVGYLGSIKTAERNVAGNLSFGGMQYLVTRPLAVGLDYIQAVARSAATFGKVKPHEYRELANTLTPAGLKVGLQGARKGAVQAVELMRTGVDVDPRSSQLKFEIGEVTFKNSFLDRVSKAVFNSLEAQDKPFYQFAMQTSLYGRARLMGIREGLKGAKLSSRIDEILANPSEEMVLGAHADAQYATFKNDTALSDAASSLRMGVRSRLRTAPPGRKAGLAGASLLMDITIPFTKVASAIVNAGIDYSPAGFARALVHAADKDPKVQGQIQQALAKATLGTGLTMLGYAMWGNGTITGSPPREKSQRKLWDASNKQANSVLIDGKWRSITWLGPLAMPLLLGANIRRFQDQGEEKSLGETVGFAAGSIGQTMTEQSYLQGLERIIGAATDPAGRGAAAAAGMVPVPAIVGQAATALDPVARETHTVGEKIQARIPFASRSLPARLDPFGEEVAKTSGGIRGAAESFLDFTSPKEDRSTLLTQELERLQMGVSGVGSTFTVQGQKYQRTPDTIRELVREIGPKMKTKLEDLILSRRYLESDDEGREKLLRKTMDQEKEPVYKRERAGQAELTLQDRIQMRIQARGRQ